MSQASSRSGRTAEHRAKIKALNDAFRTSFSGGKLFLTAGLAALPAEVRTMALAKVATYNDFDEDNDPWAEHDFGAFEYGGQTFFWKIDYYDRTLEKGSEDPSQSREDHQGTDPDARRRVLTSLKATLRA